MAQTKYKTIAFDSSYKITVPDYMEEVKDLVEGPALQLKYLGEHPLMISVLAEKKILINALDSGFTHKQYYQYVAGKVTEQLTEPEILYTRQDTMHNYTYMQGQVRGKFQGTRLVYFIRTIETKDYYYQVVIWTPEKTLLSSTIGADINTIFDSFLIIGE